MVFNDLLVNVPKVEGFVGRILKIMGRIGVFRSPPSNKMILLDDRAKFKEWLSAQSARKDIKIATVAHGAAVTTDLPGHFRQAALQM